jgi:hypothetical protein
MQPHEHAGAVRRGIVVLLLAAGCGSDSAQTDSAAKEPSPSATAVASSPAPAAASDSPAELTSANLDAYARGIAKEIEQVRAAQERERTATTPQARGEAAQAQWEDQTIPDGAKSAGLSTESYRQVRKTVNHVFQTLDFQGKIDGPMEMDTTRASPEMRKQLTQDPFDELAPASRTVLRERMDRLVPLWVQYVRLTAVAG